MKKLAALFLVAMSAACSTFEQSKAITDTPKEPLKQERKDGSLVSSNGFILDGKANVSCDRGVAKGIEGVVTNPAGERSQIIVDLSRTGKEFDLGEPRSSEDKKRLLLALRDFAKQVEPSCPVPPVIQPQDSGKNIIEPPEFLAWNGIRGWGLQPVCDGLDIKSIKGVFQNKQPFDVLFSAKLFFKNEKDEVPTIRVLKGKPTKKDIADLLEASDMLFEVLEEVHCTEENPSRNERMSGLNLSITFSYRAG